MSTIELQFVFIGLASGMILFWLIFALRGPRDIDVPDAVCVLRYGSALRVTALVFAWMPPAVLIFVTANYAWRTDEALIAAGVSFLAVGLFASLLLIDVERTQIAASEEGITRLSPWSGRGVMKWSEVKNVRYSPVNRWLVVTGAGRTIRLSRHLEGIGAFVKIARQKLPAERYAGAAAIFRALGETD